MLLLLVHRRHDDADLGRAGGAAVRALVGDGAAGGQRLDLDQRHAADPVRGRRLCLEQVEGSRQKTDGDADRLESADQFQQPFVVGILAGDDDPVSVVALDHLEGGDATGGAGVLLGRRHGADDVGVFPQRRVGAESLSDFLVAD